MENRPAKKSRLRYLRWLAVGLALAIFGCAGASKYAARSMPNTPVQARSELDELEADINRYRLSIGLPAHPRQVVATVESKQAGAETPLDKPAPKLDAERFTTKPPAKEPVQPSPPPSRDSADDAPASPARVTASGQSSRREPDRCRYTRAICAAARRICKIADYLADADAKGRCERANSDCKEARRTTQC